MTAMFRPPIARAIGWRQMLGFGQDTGAAADPRFWARVRGTQLAMLNRYVPFNVGLMALNLGALVWMLRDAGDAGFLAAWAAVMAGLAALWVVRWRRARGGEPETATIREFWAISAEVASFGLVWGALMLHMLPLVDLPTQTVMVLLSVVAMGACSFAAVLLPVCGAVLVLSIAVLTLAGLPAGSPLATPLVGLAFASFAILALRGITITSFAMMARMRTQMENAEASAVIGLLLNEFEAHGSDWLVEVDDQAQLTHVSPRLCEVSGQTREALLGLPLVDLLGPDRRDPAVRGALRTLGRYFARRIAFRDIVVPVAVLGELRWWSLTGTPKFAPDGSFAGFRGVGSDVTEARRASDRIAELARYDPLTGLANRALMRSALADALVRAERGQGACALFFIDLDRFKQVNDALGHHAGDVLLREVAARLRTITGPTPTVGRLGGDEFAVVIEDCSPRRAERIAKAIVDALSRPFDLDGQAVTVGASVGHAQGPGDGACVDTLLRAADLALYEVKGSGRGAACRFVPGMQARAEERRGLERDLAQALDRGELSLAFQPIVEASDERIVGFEALLRWTHPRLGNVPPAKFVPVAEDTGQIGRIGDWVLREACAWAARWPDDIIVSVNLSALQFDDANLPRTIRRALADNRLAASRLELEITESVFLKDRPATTAVIARLKALGVRFALDDFGTGYSSLGYLRKAEFSRIKIDRSFVQRAATDAGESTAIIQAIVSLATSLGMATTAEGTETRAEFEACRALGCGQIQGYLFGRPMPPEDATALVALKVAA
ncbi:putative bifunctional diguanylate cyclase/phosphodiesterase [Glacieibacterium frigidum]|uniref:EAL domain-containing protein n=1 Tax=Glacieibacterium frigidum TaxID=2593303 RepID=A0A552UI78_9SPHN|nr:EAL domain-containing protein [Glacieibacterium frigidum]TRW17928.1 EAL domain-containing protein [Glacieibacterium frigidum]